MRGQILQILHDCDVTELCWLGEKLVEFSLIDRRDLSRQNFLGLKIFAFLFKLIPNNTVIDDLDDVFLEPFVCEPLHEGKLSHAGRMPSHVLGVVNGDRLLMSRQFRDDAAFYHRRRENRNQLFAF